MNLVLLEPPEVATGVATLDGERARHLRQVLKVSPGDTVRIGVLDGPIGVGTVQSVGADTVSLECVFGEMPPPPRVDLLLALPRPKVLRRLWAQLAALGVRRIILTNAERVERNYFDTHVLQPESYRPLLIEGLQQARDTHVPQVSIHRQFRILVEDELDALSPGTIRVVAHPGGGASVPEVVSRANAANVLLAVGPEGGWNTFELSLLDAHGFQRGSMGGRTLRTDTACVALLALVNDAAARIVNSEW